MPVIVCDASISWRLKVIDASRITKLNVITWCINIFFSSNIIRGLQDTFSFFPLKVIFILAYLASIEFQLK